MQQMPSGKYSRDKTTTSEIAVPPGKTQNDIKMLGYTHDFLELPASANAELA